MDVREKLVELIVNASHECDDFYDLWDMRQAVDGIADFLIAHGVTVQEFGRWYWDADGETGRNIRRCSKCHNGSGWALLYCPHCGAKMSLPQPPKGE